MDSIGDYIYIILIVIAGISGLLKNKKKASDTTAPKTSKRSWEDILKELSPVEEEPDIYEEAIETVPIIPESEKRVSYQTIADSQKLVSKKNATHLHNTNTNSDNSISDNNIEVIGDNSDLIFSFSSAKDARRAFIYSEIFNRKY